MPEYIECPLSECTHVRLPNGKVVEYWGRYDHSPDRKDLSAEIIPGEGRSHVYAIAWPGLGITPVKEKPKTEPVTVEARIFSWNHSAEWAIVIPWFRLDDLVESGDRVRVTVEKIEEGE